MPFAAVVPKWIDSMPMVITVHDPPQFDWKSLPVLFGAVVAPLAVLVFPRLRELPALPAPFFMAAISAAFVARGWAYQGRFSVHIIGVTCALAVVSIQRLLRGEAQRTNRTDIISVRAASSGAPSSVCAR